MFDVSFTASFNSPLLASASNAFHTEVTEKNTEKSHVFLCVLCAERITNTSGI